MTARPIAVAALVCALAGSAAAERTDNAVIGWDGDKDAAIAHMDGSFEVRAGRDTTVAFGIVDNPSSLDWFNRDGYLPCLVTKFERDAATVQIASFGDLVTIGGVDFVAVYSRVSVTNHGTAMVDLDPMPSGGVVALTSNSTVVAPGATVEHDYVIAIDQFGGTAPWPLDADLVAAGGWDAHYMHMAAYWNDRLSSIVQLVQLPDPRLVDAYKAGFIYTHIVKDGDQLAVGENGYDRIYSHDLLGILNTLFIVGDFKDAKAFLLTIEPSIKDDELYRDGIYKFSWPWATYLRATGDLETVRAAFPTIRERTHLIESDRVGPDDILYRSFDIDAFGQWLGDDWSALFGLTTYAYLAHALGEETEATWASEQYTSLATATERELAATLDREHLAYLPCSVVEPNTANRCGEPTDANWASTLLSSGWAWDGYLWNAPQSGRMIDLVDATYDYGLGRLDGVLPPGTFGGYPGYSGSYNAGYGLAALRGTRYRSAGIHGYQFLIENAMSGPFSWWEGQQAPAPSAWTGSHPVSGTGSCPHMWGQAFATQVLVESLIAERADGSVVIGRGVPVEWADQPIELSNVPIANNKRMGFSLSGSTTEVTLALTGDQPSGNVQLALPLFIDNVCSATAGTVHASEGYVELTPGTETTTVTLGCPAADESGCSCHSGRSMPAGAGLFGIALCFVLRRRRAIYSRQSR